MKRRKTIDDEIDNVLSFLGKCQPADEEYTTAAKNLKELCEARGKKDSQIINILGIAVPAVVGILQIGMILYHEELHVITTKAIAFVVKGRI